MDETLRSHSPLSLCFSLSLSIEKYRTYRVNKHIQAVRQESQKNLKAFQQKQHSDKNNNAGKHDTDYDSDEEEEEIIVGSINSDGNNNNILNKPLLAQSKKKKQLLELESQINHGGADVGLKEFQVILEEKRIK